MNIKDSFMKIRDYIEAENIVDELEKFLIDEELKEFCDYLIERYNIDMSDDMNDFYDDSYFY